MEKHWEKEWKAEEERQRRIEEEEKWRQVAEEEQSRTAPVVGKSTESSACWHCQMWALTCQRSK